MAISYGAAGAISYWTADTNLGMVAPTGIVAGHYLLAIVGTKPDTEEPTIFGADGWTRLGSFSGGVSATTGADVGLARITVFGRTALGDESGVTFYTYSGTTSYSSADPLFGQIIRLTNATGGWSVGVAGGNDSSHGSTAVSVTCSSNPGITSGDFLLAAFATSTDAATWSARGITATSATIGAATARSTYTYNPAGNDIGGHMWTAPVTAGTATANPVLTATASVAAASDGPGILLRFRETAPAFTAPLELSGNGYMELVKRLETHYRYFRFVPWYLRNDPISATAISMSELIFVDELGDRILGDEASSVGANSPAGEGPDKINDNNTATKWLDFRGASATIQLDFGTLVRPDYYYWTTANDAPERDPIGWQVEASVDGDYWELVDPGNYHTITTARQASTQAFLLSLPAVSQDETGTLGTSGSGTLTTPSRQPGFAVARALSGAGTMSPTGKPSTTGTRALSGSGTQTRTAAVGFAAPRALSGSGTLTLVGSVQYSATVTLTGTGTLGLSGVAGLITGSVALSGSGTLSEATTLTASGSATLTGTGGQSLAVSPAFTDGTALSGSGDLNTEGILTFEGTVQLSGSGSLALVGLPRFTYTRALSGSGDLGEAGAPGFAYARALSGSGSLALEGEIPFIYTPLDTTNIVPAPYVTINGTEMPISLDERGYVILDNLSIMWGRTGVLESDRPAILSMTILDVTGDWVEHQELLGLEIITGVRFTDKDGVYHDLANFRGRITDAECVVRERDKDTHTDRGYLVYISAADKLVEVGNRFYSNQAWPPESYQDRRTRFTSALSGVVSGIGGSYVSGQLQFSSIAFDQRSLLELVRDHLLAGAEWINYDPDTNTIETSGRYVFTSGAQGLRLGQRGTTGVYQLESDASALTYDREDYNVNAASMEPKGGIKRSIESSITEVRYEHFTDNTGTAKTSKTSSTGLSEATYGRRTFGVSTESNGTNAQAFADNFAAMAQDTQTWQPPEMKWDTRRANHGLQSFIQVRGFLSGRVWDAPFFLSRSQYNKFPSQVPVYRVIGGRMTWEVNGVGVAGWVIEPVFGPVDFTTGFNPITWNTINPSYPTPKLSWDQLDENVTWDDINLTGQGV